MNISRLTFLHMLAAVGTLPPLGTTAAEPQPELIEEKRRCPLGRDYWLYHRKNTDQARPRWLVVGIHPHKGQGKGAMGLADWAIKFPDVIVVGPSFPSTGPYFQNLEGKTPEQLNGIQDLLAKEFKIHPRMFIHGYSGGAQFAHRYANRHPERLIAVSAHSAGTWSRIDHAKAKEILWTASCGLQDTAESVPGSGRRIDNFRSFAKDLHADDYAARLFVRPGTHARHPSVEQAAEAAFLAASSGIFPWQKAALAKLPAARHEAWITANDGLKDDIFDDGTVKVSLKRNPDGWTLNKQVLAILKASRHL